jgi:hypothetical protein
VAGRGGGNMVVYKIINTHAFAVHDCKS